MRPRLFVSLVLLIVVALTVLVWVQPSNRDFGPDNYSWNGLADFVSTYEASEITSLSELPLSPQGTILILIPYTGFARPELEQLEEYTATGGTLVVLDDYGYGNEVLGHLGVITRFSNHPLLDPLFNFVNDSFPTITSFSPELQSDEIQNVVLNHASSLTNTSDDEVTAWSSRFSFLDENANSERDEDEPSGPFPVASVISYESGRVVLISDPSILIMLDTNDNRRFIDNVLGVSKSNPTVFLDESHIPSSQLETAQGWLQQIRDGLATPQGIVILALGAIALIAIMSRHHEKDLPSEESPGNKGGSIDH